MYWFKECPRCSGDLVAEHDQYGDYVSCMQCGMSKDVTAVEFEPSQLTLEPVAVPEIPQSDEGIRRRLSHGGRHTYRSLNGSAVQTLAS